MKKIVSVITFAAISFTALLMAAPVLASNNTGQIQSLYFGPGAYAPRTEFYVAQATTTCGNPGAYPGAYGFGWYAFEGMDSGLGKVWAAALLAAQAQRRAIVISGNGKCDGWGMEGVTSIGFPP